MLAAQISSPDGPSAVVLTDLPDPEPGEGQALLEVHRAGVSYPDVLLARGRYQFQPALPFVPGAEVSGRVLSAPAGSGLVVGDRVAAFPGFGGFAERVAVPAALVFPVPDGMTLEVAAAVPMNYLTCLFALDRRGRLQVGETVLVHGASGGIGTAAIQVAKARGAKVVAVVSDPRTRGAVASEAGADEVVAADGFLSAVRDLTEGRGVDVVVDPVGGDRFTDSLRVLAPEGRLLVIGFTGGEIPTVKVNRLLLNNTSVVGVGWGADWMPRPHSLAEQWAALVELWEGGAVRPPVDTRYGLTEVSAAIAALEERRAVGKVVLNVRT